MSKILDKLADQHEERLINTLYRLEDDVIRAVRQATGGSLDKTDIRLAIALQPQLRATIENVFLNEADLLINDDYNKIAKDVLDEFGKMPIPARFKNLTEVDLVTIDALKRQTFEGFEDIAERFLKEINDLVDFINENKFNPKMKAQVDEAIRKLHTQYASDRSGENLRKYAGQIAHDSVMQFHGQFTIKKAKDAGLTHFRYTGTLIRDSRQFCREMVNKTLTETEIRDMWKRRSWAGKSNGDPFIVRGGYRCRHTWLPTDPNWNI